MGQDELPVRLEHVRERMARAARRAGRDPHEITLVAAAKTVSPERTMTAIQCGLQHIGENRVQEAESKFESLSALRQSATWHLIGHLQTNKARRALESFDVIQSVDSLRLAQHLEQIAAERNQPLPVFIEVNIGAEPSKSGVYPNDLKSVAATVSHFRHLRVEGLMAVPPYLDDPEEVRPFFRTLRQLRDAVNEWQLFDYAVSGLSMGMSHDFEVAIEEGATLVRLGTALFGPRPAG